jgi:hypothetical protein
MKVVESIPPRSKILDRAAFRRKLVLRLLASPLTLAPLLLGLTDLLALWAFSISSGMGVFAGLTGILGGLGIFLTRLFVDRGVGEEVVAALEKEATAAREASLDELERRLSADGDPRDNQSLRELRTLARVFRERFSRPERLGSAATVEILSGVDELFDRCVRSIEMTLDLWYTAHEMGAGEARDAVLERREQILTEVGASIRQMGRILAGLQHLQAEDGGAESELARLRQELGQSLEVAKRVSRRMQQIDREIGGRLEDERRP